jgi:hypothetical protein
MVKATLAWPRRSLTTFTWTPAFSRIVAWVCRRSCRRIRGIVDGEDRDLGDRVDEHQVEEELDEGDRL